MSPSAALAASWQTRFPRVNGDEPTLAAECESQGLFSPRERG